MEEEREPQINKLFRVAKEYKASQLELEPGSAPTLKVDGKRRELEMKSLSHTDLHQLLLPILYFEQKLDLDQGKEIHFNYVFEEGTVFRVTAFTKNSSLKVIAEVYARA